MKRKHLPEEGHRPERTCIVCREKFYKFDLCRMVLHGNEVMFDRRQVMPGRGAYVCKSPVCQERVFENFKGCLNRAFRKGGIGFKDRSDVEC